MNRTIVAIRPFAIILFGKKTRDEKLTNVVNIYEMDPVQKHLAPCMCSLLMLPYRIGNNRPWHKSATGIIVVVKRIMQLWPHPE